MSIREEWCPLFQTAYLQQYFTRVPFIRLKKFTRQKLVKLQRPKIGIKVKTRKAILPWANKNKFPNSNPNLGVHYFRFHRHPIQLKSSLIKGRT